MGRGRRRAQPPFTLQARKESGAELPLDEGDAVVSLASQGGVAEAAQALPQLDEGLLHAAPRGCGERAGVG